MCNAKDCEQYHPDNICCTCQNLEWYKLEQTITEIKEIAEKGHKERGNLMRTWWFKEILQKISEVEDE